MIVKYANAYTEVYKILECLEEESYEKIPKEFLQVIEENRNLDYEYEINEEQDLSEQPMLIETRAILLNIFRDYLATPEQRKKIEKWQDEDRKKLEMAKKEKYVIDVFEKKKSNVTNSIILVENKSLFNKIIDKIKDFFKR